MGGLQLSMLSEFQKAWYATSRSEGGYSNNPNDSGGETNHGITIAEARAHGYNGPMRELPKSKAVEIAKAAYWDVMRLDDVSAVSPKVAHELFDTGFNAGTVRAVKFLQRALNSLNRRGMDYSDVTVDGILGNRTIIALKMFIALRGFGGEAVLLTVLNCLQGAFYVHLTERREKDEEFLYGWIRTRVAI